MQIHTDTMGRPNLNNLGHEELQNLLTFSAQNPNRFDKSIVQEINQKLSGSVIAQKEINKGLTDAVAQGVQAGIMTPDQGNTVLRTNKIVSNLSQGAGVLTMQAFQSFSKGDMQSGLDYTMKAMQKLASKVGGFESTGNLMSELQQKAEFATAAERGSPMAWTPNNPMAPSAVLTKQSSARTPIANKFSKTAAARQA